MERWYRTFGSLHDTIAALHDKDVPHEVEFIINKISVRAKPSHVLGGNAHDAPPWTQLRFF